MGKGKAFHHLRGIIFDLGHTLMDFQGEWEDVERRGAEGLLRFLRRNGFPVTEEVVRYFAARREEGHLQADLSLVEHTASLVFEETVQKFGLNGNVKKVMLKALEEYFQPELESWKARPDSLDVLRALKQDYRIGLISNATHHPFIESCLRKFGFEEYLEPAVSSAAFHVRKPHPEIFGHVADRWKLSPEEIVVVGDQLYFDIYGAHQAGMKGVWLEEPSDNAHTFIPEALKSDPKLRPDATIRRLEELLPWLK